MSKLPETVELDTSSLVAPHGGKLVDRIVAPTAVEALEARAATLPKVVMDARETADLELIATGAVSPIDGFLGNADYTSVVENLRLVDGDVWPLPLSLAVDAELRAKVEKATAAALYDEAGRLWGVIDVTDAFVRDPLVEARHVYGTEDPAHPGVAYLLSRPVHLLGGRVTVLPLPEDLPFAEHRNTPAQLREKIAALGWKKVAGFQTRNPIHRAHEHLTKLALEFSDGLVIHPLVGETKSDDVPAKVRFEAYQLLLEKYYPKGRTLLSVFPAAMRYAGPREALFHALVRKNYGITSLVVGRDHAGVGKFYGPYESQQIFDRFSFEELGVRPLKFEPTFFCRACENLASTRTCPHEPSQRVELSGTRVRELLRAGGNLPREFTRPEVAEILRAHYLAQAGAQLNPQAGKLAALASGGAPSAALQSSAQNSTQASQTGNSSGNSPASSGSSGSSGAQATPSGLANPANSESGAKLGSLQNPSISSSTAQAGASALDFANSPTRNGKGGFILWFTGLSGAGKSTLAQHVRAAVLAERRVEVLDGDEVRTYLSKGLGFSREDRDTNIRRIGFVARLAARNGAAAITAAISPYASTRDEVRQLAVDEGIPFVEVYVEASLDTLVERDVKGLYKKALAGEIQHFTGVSDPYEAPENPDVRVSSDSQSVEESTAQILEYLRAQGLLGSGGQQVAA